MLLIWPIKLPEQSYRPSARYGGFLGTFMVCDAGPGPPLSCITH